MQPDDAIPLSQLISSLREELLLALKQGKGKALRFEVQETVIELSVAVTKKVGGEGGVSFWVYTAKASGGLDHVTTQKVTLKLKPVGVKGPFLVRGKNVKPPKGVAPPEP